jgi:CBS domain-containing protein
MISDVVTIDSSASIIDAARQMISEEKGPLPVMEGDSLRAVITDRDIIRTWSPKGEIQTR